MSSCQEETLVHLCQLLYIHLAGFLLYSCITVGCGARSSRCSSGRIIQDELEMRADKMSASCLDENVCLMTYQKYFTHDAWTEVPQVVLSKKILHMVLWVVKLSYYG